jgi:hypothetical protein
MAGEIGEARQPERAERRGIWLGIWMGVIGSLLVWPITTFVFQPLLPVATNVAVSVVGTMYKGYLDRLYARATLDPSAFVMQFLFLWVVLLPVLLLFGQLFLTFYYRSSIRRRLLSTAPAPTKLGIIKVIGMLLLVLLLFLVFVTGVSLDVFFPMKTKATFERQLMALAPVISEKEKNYLLRDWAMMKSKSDFDKLRSKIDAMAEKYGETLP